jgi:hypothetical protein
VPSEQRADIGGVEFDDLVAFDSPGARAAGGADRD